MACPDRHEFATPLQGIAAPVGRFRFAFESMRQRRPADFARKRSLFAAPIAEAASKTVHSYIAVAHAAQRHRHCHV